MPYLFLTGATGLLGRYLIKDLTLAGVPLAVLVRPSRRATARQRVENVMCHLDGLLGRPLARPVVLEGDITEPDLGLDGRSLQWVADNCDTMLHNAASLTFNSTSPQSEPWRSNVAGTRHVLDLCRQARVRRFHHVSTAYVCGLRHGRVLESELDVGQETSNDYERSKVQSEQMVRAADFIESLTVHRPAIIIGDSQTGYTTTYHGFYALLQAVYTMAQTFESNATGLPRAAARFAVSGNETKNLVPVDWVSAVMTHVITHPDHHGKTYHLTPTHPIPSRLLADIFEEAVGFYGVSFLGVENPPTGLSEIEQLYYDLISVYNSYWKDDPAFDATNTRLAAPHLPCPHVDRKTLMKLSKYAMSVNFTSPRAKPIEPKFDVSAALEPLLAAAEPAPETVAAETRLGLRVTGHGGGDWSLVIRENEIAAAGVGIHPRCAALVECDIDVFASLASGESSVEERLASGKLSIHGDATLRPGILLAFTRLAELGRQLAGSSAA